MQLFLKTFRYTGKLCDVNIDDCLGHSCMNNATCIDGINSYECSCATGFTGYYCETSRLVYEKNSYLLLNSLFRHRRLSVWSRCQERRGTSPDVEGKFFSAWLLWRHWNVHRFSQRLFVLLRRWLHWSILRRWYGTPFSFK